MDKIKAREVANAVIDLLELCARYEGQYGKGIATHHGPPAQQELASRIYAKQVEIARLLDNAALTLPKTETSEWKHFAHHAETALTEDMLRAAGHLVMFCAERDTDKHTPEFMDKMIAKTQQVIAHMLDPKAIRERLQA
jgi:hypothetical protein